MQGEAPRSWRLTRFQTMIRLTSLNRAASLAILPLMALALVFAWRIQGAAAEPPAVPTSGLLVVANLRAGTLTFHDFAAGASRTLAVFGPPHEMVEVNGRLVVTLGRAGAVLEVDPRAPGIVARHAYDGDYPHGIALAPDGRLAITLDESDRVDFVELPAFAHDYHDTGDTPHAIALDGADAYVTGSRDNALRLLDASGATVRVVATRALPESVAIAGDFVVTANADDASLSVFRRGSLDVVATVALGGQPVRVVALSASEVAVSLSDRAQVAIVDLAEGRVVRRVATLPRPDGICVDPTGDYVAVASNDAAKVQVFRRSDWKLAGAFAAGDGPGACLWAS